MHWYFSFFLFCPCMINLSDTFSPHPFINTKFVLSVLQFLYHAWITDPKAALRARGKEKRKFWKKYTKGVRHRKSKKDGKQVLETRNLWNKLKNTTKHHVSCLYCTSAGHVAIEVGELSDGQEKGEENKKSGAPGWFLLKKNIDLILCCWVPQSENALAPDSRYWMRNIIMKNLNAVLITTVCLFWSFDLSLAVI